jgi:hypothetical protein
MSIMKKFITEKISHLKPITLKEEKFTVDGDIQKIKIEASPINKREVQKMFDQGHGIRILVGAGDMSNFMAVWIGDSDSSTNEGAMHETIANQLGITDMYVPLEKTAGGTLRITTTAQSFFDEPSEAEDALTRNKEYNKVFGTDTVDYSKLSGGW